MVSLFQIVIKCVRNFSAKVDNRFIPSFSPDFNAVVFEIHIGNIKPHTFRNPDASAKEQGQERNVTEFCFVMVFKLAFG